MNFQQIEYFIAIVENESFSRAADLAFISQSALSKQIKNLESELGVELMTRGPHKFTLTNAGADFFGFAKKVHTAYEKMLEQMSQYRSEQEQSISVGILPILAQYGILDCLIKFRARHLNIRVELVEDSQQELIRMLEDRELEFAFARTDFLLHKNKYDILPLVTEEFVFVCSRKHPFAKRNSLSIKELKNEKFLFIDKQSTIYHICYKACASSGFMPNIRSTISRHVPLLRMVAENLGVSIMPSNLVDMSDDGAYTYVPLKEEITTTIALLKLKGKSLSQYEEAFVRAFKEFSKHHYSKS